MKRAPVVATIMPTQPSRKQFPMLPWYPASFMASTRGWSITAKGLYRELLDVQWEQGRLPADASELRDLIGAKKTEWKEWPRVEPKFPICADGLRRNQRLEAHRAKAADRSAKATESANAKWEKEREKRIRSGGMSDANA